QQIGVSEIFPPGTSTGAIIEYIKNHLKERNL
ncbi:MAG: methylmalonyl-CoA mutase, partial [Acidobacteria bacterium]